MVRTARYVKFVYNSHYSQSETRTAPDNSGAEPVPQDAPSVLSKRKRNLSETTTGLKSSAVVKASSASSATAKAAAPRATSAVTKTSALCSSSAVKKAAPMPTTSDNSGEDLDAKSVKAQIEAEKIAKLPNKGYIRHKDENHLIVRPWNGTNPNTCEAYFRNQYFSSGMIDLPAGTTMRHETGIDYVHVSHQHILVELTSSWPTATSLACLSTRNRRVSSL